MQIELSKQRTKQLESEIEQLKKGGMQIEKETERIEKEIALLNWMHSEIDLIEADLPSNSTPPPTTAANSSDC
jgi:cell division protein FtsB